MYIEESFIINDHLQKVTQQGIAFDFKIIPVRLMYIKLYNFLYITMGLVKL